MVPAGVLAEAKGGGPPAHGVGEPTLSWRSLLAAARPSRDRLPYLQPSPAPAALTPADLAREIGDAKRALEEGLGCSIPVFAWVGGEEETYSAAAGERSGAPASGSAS